MHFIFVTSRMDIPSLSRIIHDNLTDRICNILIIIDMIEINICETHCARLKID